MSKRSKYRKRQQSPSTNAEKPAAPAKHGIDFEDFTEADRIFQESLATLGAPPAKDQEDDERRQSQSSAGRTGGQSKAAARQRSVDLHGLTVAEATARVDAVLHSVLQTMASGRAGQVSLLIITGKGLHSGPGGAILAREIHQHVQRAFRAFIAFIDASPADVAIGGVPLRGHFRVTLQK